MNAILYDRKKHGEIKPGETLLFYDNGEFEKVPTADLYPPPIPAPAHNTGDNRESWSEGGMIHFLDGYAWGDTFEGDTVCMGTESAVRAAIDNPRLLCRNYEIDRIMELERKYIREEKESYGKRPEGKPNYRASRPGKPDNKRVRPMSVTRNFRRNIGRPAPVQKNTLHRVKPEQPSLFGPGSPELAR